MIPTIDRPAISKADMPFIIESEDHYDRALEIAENLFFKKDKTPEEIQISNVWAALIEFYEQENFSPGSEASPLNVLEALMDARNFIQEDLVKAGIASRGVVSEIVNDKRGISKSVAKKLSALFHVDVSLFV